MLEGPFGHVVIESSQHRDVCRDDGVDVRQGWAGSTAMVYGTYSHGVLRLDITQKFGPGFYYVLRSSKKVEDFLVN